MSGLLEDFSVHVNDTAALLGDIAGHLEVLSDERCMDDQALLTALKALPNMVRKCRSGAYIDMEVAVEALRHKCERINLGDARTENDFSQKWCSLAAMLQEAAVSLPTAAAYWIDMQGVVSSAVRALKKQTSSANFDAMMGRAQPSSFQGKASMDAIRVVVEHLLADASTFTDKLEKHLVVFFVAIFDFIGGNAKEPKDISDFLGLLQKVSSSSLWSGKLPEETPDRLRGPHAWEPLVACYRKVVDDGTNTEIILQRAGIDEDMIDILGHRAAFLKLGTMIKESKALSIAAHSGNDLVTKVGNARLVSMREAMVSKREALKAMDRGPRGAPWTDSTPPSKADDVQTVLKVAHECLDSMDGAAFAAILDAAILARENFEKTATLYNRKPSDDTEYATTHDVIQDAQTTQLTGIMLF